MLSQLLYGTIVDENIQLLEILMILTAFIFLLATIYYIVKIYNVQKSYKAANISIKLYAPNLAYYILSTMTLLFTLMFIVLAFIAENRVFTILHSCLAVMTTCLLVMFIARIIAKSGVGENGIYLFTKFVPWKMLHDFFIFENKYKVVLSTNWKGWQSLIGTTFPLRFNSENLTALKTVLSQNKNKFFESLELR